MAFLADLFLASCVLKGTFESIDHSEALSCANLSVALVPAGRCLGQDKKNKINLHPHANTSIFFHSFEAMQLHQTHSSGKSEWHPKLLPGFFLYLL